MSIRLYDHGLGAPRQRGVRQALTEWLGERPPPQLAEAAPEVAGLRTAAGSELCLVVLQDMAAFSIFEDDILHDLLLEAARDIDIGWLATRADFTAGLASRDLGVAVSTYDAADLARPCAAVLCGSDRPGADFLAGASITAPGNAQAYLAEVLDRRGTYASASRPTGKLTGKPLAGASGRSAPDPGRPGLITRADFVGLTSAYHDDAQLGALASQIVAQHPLPELDGHDRVMPFLLSEPPEGRSQLRLRFEEGEYVRPGIGNLFRGGAPKGVSGVTVRFAEPAKPTKPPVDYHLNRGELCVVVRCAPQSRAYWERFFCTCLLDFEGTHGNA